MKDLTEIRVEIDAIDSELLDLFKRRMDCAKEVAAYKQAHGIPVLNRAREEEILDRVEKDGEYGGYARRFYESLMALSRELQQEIIRKGADHETM